MAHSKLIVLNHIKKVYDSFPVKTITADDGSVKKKIDWYAIAMEKKYFGWRSFFIVLFYLSCGVLWYCIRDGWGFVDALYFSIVTVTTVCRSLVCVSMFHTFGDIQKVLLFERVPTYFYLYILRFTF